MIKNLEGKCERIGCKYYELRAGDTSRCPCKMVHVVLLRALRTRSPSLHTMGSFVVITVVVSRHIRHIKLSGSNSLNSLRGKRKLERDYQRCDG